MPPPNAVPIAIAKAKARQEFLDRKGQGGKVLPFNQGTSTFGLMQEIIDAKIKAASSPTSLYPPQESNLSLREAAVEFYKRVFEVPVEFNLDTECTPILGAKSALSQAITAFNGRTDENGNYRNTVAFYTPAYSSYYANDALAGAETLTIPMNRENSYRPNLKELITPEQAKTISTLIINYPHNPTGAVATKEYMQDLVNFAKEHGILIVSDNPYAFTLLDPSLSPLSIFHAEGAKDCAIELFSGSKCFNIGGDRIGIAIGNENAIKAFKTVRSNQDAGPPAVSAAGFEAALRHPDIRSQMQKESAIYAERAALLQEGLVDRFGYPFTDTTRASLYSWIKVPPYYIEQGTESLTAAQTFADYLLEKANISVIPGNAYGDDPESTSHIRFTLNRPKEMITEALDNMQNADISWIK